MKTSIVGLAEGRVSNSPGEVLTVIGLGSCVAVVMYDRVAHVGAVAHVMLPRGSGSEVPAKYADTAVPYLLESMVNVGADPTRVQAGLFGGAALLTQGQSSLLEIGERNVQAVRDALERAGVPSPVGDVGGTKGRTVHVTVGSGQVTVKVLGQPDRVYEELTEKAEVPR